MSADVMRLTVAEVACRVAEIKVPAAHRATPAEIEAIEALGRRLVSDSRLGVGRLGERLQRAAETLRAERRRAASLVEAEAAYCPADTSTLAGVDEAGRGPLAGPVVAAAVILKPGVVIPGLDDSKRLAEDVREEVYEAVIAASLSVGIGVVGTALVERINVLKATHVAMRRALADLGLRPGYVLVDGYRLPGIDLPQRGVIGGDALCGSVAAASIVAKVTRDRIMRKVAKRYPVYGFERNKGYATPEHREALDRFGPCRAHRLSFLRRQEPDDPGLFSPEGEGHVTPETEGREDEG